MTCEHPDCTGVHNHHRPYAEWCPATKRRQHRRQAGTWQQQRHQRRSNRKRATERDLETLRRLRGEA